MIFLLKFLLLADLAHNSFHFWEISPFKAPIMYITALDFIVLNVARLIKLSFCTYTLINFCLHNKFNFISHSEISIPCIYIHVEWENYCVMHAEISRMFKYCQYHILVFYSCCFHCIRDFLNHELMFTRLLILFYRRNQKFSKPQAIFPSCSLSSTALFFKILRL